MDRKFYSTRMTEPRPAQDPSPSQEPSGNYDAPQPPPSYEAPMGGTAPGYAAPGYAAPPPGMAPVPAPYSDLVGRQLTPDEKTWSMLAHLGGIVLGFLAPLIVMLTKGNESPYTRHNSVEALNFQITILIGYVVATILMLVLIGFLLWPLLYIANIVLCVMAGIAANKGETYKYRFTLRLVK